MQAQTASPLETYRSYLRQHHLAYQYSPAADKAVFYPRLVCPFTGSSELQWRISKGSGTVHATTTVYPREGAAYNVALIELDEGFRMMSRVEGLDAEAVQIGQRVQVAFQAASETSDDAAPLPIFTLIEETTA
ncbi:hypothetical protein E9531_16485 [Lampropedia puyangensis]|uniref:ChsH2 C-terminal OB-fold domain-containing protein n=1 Tax=Lampropedia puyangensis TaxID=1330072 RepID=A0A4S8ENN7_9BURK|nr:OB-fold domain-containing protein [Lampropedia puyangensis]THT96297.1 hypothetical protein E9531_16485 [Lampropedia puyangensis]